MAKLIIDYANENNIILNISDKNVEGWYPLLFATSHDNNEMIQLITDYTIKNIIKLNVNDKNIDRRSTFPDTVNKTDSTFLSGIILKLFIIIIYIKYDF